MSRHRLTDDPALSFRRNGKLARGAGRDLCEAIICSAVCRSMAQERTSLASDR